MLRTLDGFADRIESREVGELGRRGPQELGHLVVVVVLEVQLIVLVQDQVLGAVVCAAGAAVHGRVDGVTGRGRGHLVVAGHAAGVMVVVADCPITNGLALDHVGGHGRPAAVVLRYPVVVYRSRANGLLGLLIERHSRLMVDDAATAAVLLAVHGGRRTQRVRLLAVLLLLLLLGRVLLQRIRFGTDFALDHLDTGPVVRVVILWLLLLHGRQTFLGLALCRPRAAHQHGDGDERGHRPQRRARRRGGFRHRHSRD